MLGSESEPPVSHSLPMAAAADGWCSCACSCHRLPRMSISLSRSVKRKLDQVEQVGHYLQLQPFSDAPSIDVLARVEFENECFALREALVRQQQTIHDLYRELDEERNASSTAANEAMSMILRLQREKAEAQMEARQFKRFAEERMAHDQEEILALEDVFYSRDQAVQALSCEVQAYKHRLLSFGINPDSDPADFATPNERDIGDSEEEAIANNTNSDNDGVRLPVSDYPAYDYYPPLRCKFPDVGLSDEITDLEKYPLGDTPRTPGSSRAVEHLRHIEQRIYQMERTTSSNVMEKGVVIGNSPRRPRHTRNFSADSVGSLASREFVHDYSFKGKRNCELPAIINCTSDEGGDDMSDRIYTIDAVHGVAPSAPAVGMCDDYMSTPRGSVIRRGISMDDADIKKLYVRLQALEADRESLKQAIISMRTDKAQLVLLREIAQNLCKGVTPPTMAPEKKLMRKASLVGSFSFLCVFKWITSFIFWKKKSKRSRYMFGLSNNNVGLLLLLEKSSHMRQRICLARAHG